MLHVNLESALGKPGPDLMNNKKVHMMASKASMYTWPSESMVEERIAVA